MGCDISLLLLLYQVYLLTSGEPVLCIRDLWLCCAMHLVGGDSWPRDRKVSSPGGLSCWMS